jgi:hypothetical protein
MNFDNSYLELIGAWVFLERVILFDQEMSVCKKDVTGFGHILTVSLPLHLFLFLA